MTIKIALPKGRLLAETAALMNKSGWGLTGYQEGARIYRLQSTTLSDVSARMFHEKDIPIQVVMGNYDLGICGLDWIEELLAKYPSSALVRVKDLGYGNTALFMVADPSGALSTIDDITASTGVIRIASEYPNLAEAFALKYRLKRFNIFPVWGAAEAYPPENAELALISSSTGKMPSGNLAPLYQILNSGACLVANKNSWENKDLSQVLSSISSIVAPSPYSTGSAGIAPETLPEIKCKKIALNTIEDENSLWLALPDGHQQKHTISLLEQAGIPIEGYHARGKNHRPDIGLENVLVKVIRPQDMPLQVANGNFDIAISGRDWLDEHLDAFPSSPVVELLDLKSARVKIVAVVSEDTGINDIDGLRHFYDTGAGALRIASEYINIADNFARRHRLGKYRIIPTWGASEAFVPEDADVLIENTETGQTLKRHNLRIIDTLFESTGCLIGNTGSIASTGKGKRIKQITEMLRKAVG
jgi:ATP phosphoribosyltransferase